MGGMTLGYGLGFLGALAGGPVGAVVLGAAGSIGGTFIGSVLIDKLTESLFDLPPTVALEKAYDYLGVHHTATNGELNQAFHRLCLKHHPDKGGNQEDFLKLQCQFELIKLARGEIPKN